MNPILTAPGRTPALPGRAVFIDKDGTLVENVPYNVDPAKVRFTPNALEGLRLLVRPVGERRLEGRVEVHVLRLVARRVRVRHVGRERGLAHGRALDGALEA